MKKIIWLFGLLSLCLFMDAVYFYPPCKAAPSEEFLRFGVHVSAMGNLDPHFAAASQDRALADKVLRDIPVSFPILFDDSNLVSELYQVDAMPVTVLVDRNGDIRYMHRGYKPGYEQAYEEQLRTLIKE